MSDDRKPSPSRPARRIIYRRTRNVGAPDREPTKADVWKKRRRVSPGPARENWIAIGVGDHANFTTDWVRYCSDHVATAQLGGGRRRRRSCARLVGCCRGSSRNSYR
jgi:hypothetical protein